MALEKWAKGVAASSQKSRDQQRLNVYVQRSAQSHAYETDVNETRRGICSLLLDAASWGKLGKQPRPGPEPGA